MVVNKASLKKGRGKTNRAILEIIREGGSRQKNQTSEKNSREKLLRRQFEQLQFTRRQEQLVFAQKQQKEQLQIKAIQEELKKLAHSVKNLDKEIEKAVVQAPIDPGIYHLNFFEKLREIIALIRKRVEESATWLEVFNKRTAKRKVYWAQFKKLGTQWSLSGERYITTSVG